MEIGLKERLVGAIVLVAVGVIVIPMILKGPGKPQSQSETIALPSPAIQSHPQTYRLPLNSDRKPETAAIAGPMPASDSAAAPVTGATTVPLHASGPAPASTTPKTELPPPPKPVTQTPTTSKPEASTATTRPKPAPGSSRPAAAPATNGSQWVVQAGSFSNAGNAEKLVTSLKSKGFKAYLTTFTAGSRTYYRVRVGPYPDRAAADKAAPAVAKAAGGKADVLPAS